MFITLTINTNQKKKLFINLHKSKIDAKSGWRKAIHIKKRPLWQRVKAWHRNLKPGQYKEASTKALSTVLSKNFDPRVQNRTLRSKFSCRLVSSAFVEASKLDGQVAMF